MDILGIITLVIAILSFGWVCFKCRIQDCERYLQV